MDTNGLKKFAQSARTQLMAAVKAKLAIVLAEGSAARRENPTAARALEGQIRERGEAQVVEQVAYTWFNRFTALRFILNPAVALRLLGSWMSMATPASACSRQQKARPALKFSLRRWLGTSTRRCRSQCAPRLRRCSTAARPQLTHRARPTGCCWWPPATLSDPGIPP
jgi:hypothetical protein